MEGVRATAELAQPLVASPERAARKLRRDIGLLGLLFASLGSIIGAGWLFGALYASSLAGPAAVISWVLGGGVVMLLALTHAELGGMYPVAGGSARFPRYAFGNLIGFTSGWIAFLGAVTVGPIMVEAMLLYTSNYISSLTTVSGGRPVLTVQGYFVAGTLLLLFCTINVMGVRWLADINMLAVCWKLLVPAVTVVALIATSAHTENFSAHGGFMPFGWKGVFLALSSGGVIFAGLGFEQAVQLGGETRNPRRNIPFAIIGGMTVAIVLYIALQVAFILALDPSELSKGWGAVSFSGNGLFGPFAALATALGLGWLAVLLYTDAIVSPGGTGLIYTGASARLTFALASQRLYPLGLRPPHATRNAFLRDRVLVPLRLGDPPSVPGLAAAGRLHLGSGRGRVRNGAARARSAQASRPCAATPLQASGRIVAGAWNVRRRERDPALHRLGRDLEADRGDPDRVCAAGRLDCHRFDRAEPVARLAKRRLALAVPARHGCDLVPQLVRHENAQLDPAARPPRASQRAHVRLGHSRRCASSASSSTPSRSVSRLPARAGARLHRRSDRGGAGRDRRSGPDVRVSASQGCFRSPATVGPRAGGEDQHLQRRAARPRTGSTRSRPRAPPAP